MRRFVLLIIPALFMAGTLCAGEEKPFAREVLCLSETADDEVSVRGQLEMVFNHYGYIVRYRSQSELPDIRNLSGTAAIVVSSSSSRHPDPPAFHSWLHAAMARGIKLIIYRSLPAQIRSRTEEPVELEAYNRFLSPLGLEFRGYSDKNPADRKIVERDPEVMSGERAYVDAFQILPRLRAVGEGVRAHFSLADHSGAKRCDLVISGPFGGLALNPALIYIDAIDRQKMQWIVDPFAFVCRALGRESFPIPDVTTISGRRILYCHVDGDAFTGVCTFERDSICGEVLYRDHLRRFPWPHTLSLVMCWFDPLVSKVLVRTVYEGEELRQDRVEIPKRERERWSEVARRIFTEPWVEASVHGYGHPLKWEQETLAVEPVGRSFSLADEFGRSWQLLSGLLPKGGTVAKKVFLWSGDCMPTSPQLRVLVESGCDNINGGDSRRDSVFASDLYLAPLARELSGGLQVYASACNENIYTNGWTGPFYGFRNVIESFENTDKTRRLQPVNIYYHWFSGELKASMHALNEVYDWAAARPLVRVFASRHIDNVQGFYSARISRIEGGWMVRDMGALKTLRFDGERRVPEVGRGSNVIGYIMEKDRLYVHLGPREEARISWLEQETQQVRLSWATADVRGFEVDKKGVRLTLWGYDRVSFSIAGLGKRRLALGGVPLPVLQGEAVCEGVELRGEREILLEWSGL
ncbi:MAG: hypothetical protein HQL31_00180 [Planctomycetes bacterium]|nr:hypothetical protein [Planctomycetota bacterium]